MREGIIYIKEERHCVEQMWLKSCKVVKKQNSDVKVKACYKCLADRTLETMELDLSAAHIQKSDFWNLLPFRKLNWLQNE